MSVSVSVGVGVNVNCVGRYGGMEDLGEREGVGGGGALSSSACLGDLAGRRGQ